MGNYIYARTSHGTFYYRGVGLLGDVRTDEGRNFLTVVIGDLCR